MPTTFTINTDDNYSQSQSFNIEGVLYRMTTYYNFRKGWYVGLYNNEDDTPIRIGVNVMPVAPIFNDVEAIEGEIWCMPNEDFVDIKPITQDNFGQGKLYNLVYLSKEELSELRLSIELGLV